MSNIDPTPAFGFGHGLTYTTFAWSDLVTYTGKRPPTVRFSLALTVRNTGERHGTEVVQLYLHDPVASVVQPVQRLIGYTRVPLAPARPAGYASRSRPTSPPSPDATAAASSSRASWNCGSRRPAPPRALTATVTLTGPVRHVDHTRRLHAVFGQENAADA